MAASRWDYVSITTKDSVKAWKGEYQGNAHKTLLNNIQLRGKWDANSGAIIQSSGYGKSRTVDQMATLIPTIPMNIRAAEDEKQGAYPPADGALRRLLDYMRLLPNPVNALHLFFKLLFEHVAKLAEGFKTGDLTTELRSWFECSENRQQFYTDLSNNFRSDEHLAVESCFAGATTAFEKLAVLLPYIQNKEGTSKVAMVVYIDEAHTLDEMINQSRYSMYDYMLKATADLYTLPVFFLFLSTTPRLKATASERVLSGSARFRGALKPVAPFTEMSFDCHPTLVKDAIQPGMKLEDVQKFAFIVRFGRPLFWAYYEAMCAHKHAVTAKDDTTSMAMVKLISKAEVEMPGDAGKLAILDTLLNLKFDPRRTQSHQLASTMVASHLRTVYCVPRGSTYMHTGYPSEPVLAEAALEFVDRMFRSPSTQYMEHETMLQLYYDLDRTMPGVIDEGERGENIGKMILLRAYIAAVKQGQHMVDLWSGGCSLLGFLTALTGEEYFDQVMASVPDNVMDGATLQSRFGKSWVCFTHFARAADDSAMTSSMAWVAFVRGMAMIGCKSSQHVVDVSIPILLDRDRPIEEANISAILVQFKAREVRIPPPRVAIEEKTIKFFPPPNSTRDPFPDSIKDPKSETLRTSHRSRPFISLVMGLGVVRPSNKASIPSKVVDSLDNPSKQPVNRTRADSADTPVPPPLNPALEPQSARQSQSEVHPRYSLFYYGCSSKVYRCIPNQPYIAETYRRLLRIAAVFNDRDTARDIAPILQMKPFWSTGSTSFSSVHDPYFRGLEELTGDEQSDEVLIGGTHFDMDVDDHGEC